MFCEKCGTAMEENAQFCPECGNPIGMEQGIGDESGEEAAEGVKEEGRREKRQVVYCPSCGERNEADAVFCLSCGAPLKEDMVSDNGNKKEAAAGKKNKKLFAGVGTVVIAAAVIAGIVFGIKGFGGKAKDLPLVYIKDNEIIGFLKEQKNNYGGSIRKEKSEITGQGSGLGDVVQFSADGKYIYYPVNYKEDSFDLYYRKAKDDKTDGEKLASSVDSYRVLKNGKIIYTEGQKLYIADFSNKEKVASDVEIYYVSEDEGSLFWTTSGDESRMYVCDTALQNEKIKLDSDVTSVIYISDNIETIIYQKEEGLYCLKDYEERQKVTGGEILDWYTVGSGDKTELYYALKGDEEILVSDVLEDDCAGEDAKETERTEEEEVKKYVRDIYRQSMEEADIETTALYRYIPGEAESEEIAEGLLYLGISGGMDEPVFSYAYFDMDQFEKIKMSEWTQEGWKLYEKSGDAGDFDKMYIKKRLEGLAEVMEMRLISEGQEIILDYDAEEYGILPMGIGAAENLKEYYIAAIDMETYLQALMEESEENPVGEESYEDYDGEGYYEEDYGYGREDDIEGSEDSGAEAALAETAEDGDVPEGISVTILKVNYGEMDGKVEQISEAAKAYMGGSDPFHLTADGIYFIEDADKGKGELCFNGSRVDSDVMPGSLKQLPGKKGILYIADPNDEMTEGMLKMYDGSETKKIADDVADFGSNERGEIFFLTNYNFTKYKGDLKQYKKGEVISVDDDVTGILWCYE